MMLGGQYLEEVSTQSGFYVASLSLLNCGVYSVWAAQVTPNLCVAAKIAFWIPSGGTKAAKFKDLKYCWLKGLICRFI